VVAWNNWERYRLYRKRLGSKGFKIEKKEQLNKIMMVVKWKTHVNKQAGKECWLYQILHDIKQMIKIEGWISAKNDKSANHKEMWEEIEDYIT
jgi:hypothetical protein